MTTPKRTLSLHIGRPPIHDAELLVWWLTAFRKLTGREPTPEEVADARAEIEAPHRL